MSNDLSFESAREALEWVEKLYHVIYFDHVSWNDDCDELKETTVQLDGAWRSETIDCEINDSYSLYSLFHGNYTMKNPLLACECNQDKFGISTAAWWVFSLVFSASFIKWNSQIWKSIFKINLSTSRKFFIYVIFFLLFSGNWHYRKSFPSLLLLPREMRLYYKYNWREMFRNRKLFSLLLQEERKESDFPLNHYSEKQKWINMK